MHIENAMKALLSAVCAALVVFHAHAECTRSQWEDRLDVDFEVFAGGFRGDDLNAAERRVQGGYRVLLLDNKLHAIPIGWEVGFLEGRGHTVHEIFILLHRALAAHRMPDVEFVLNVFDRKGVIDDNRPVPILSWSKDTYWQDHDILYPYWQFLYLNATVAGLRADEFPWDSRQPRAYFRGSTTGGMFRPGNWRHMIRSRLVATCKRVSALCDAGITGYPQVVDGVEATMRKELGSWPKSDAHEASRCVVRVHCSVRGLRRWREGARRETNACITTLTRLFPQLSPATSTT